MSLLVFIIVLLAVPAAVVLLLFLVEKVHRRREYRRTIELALWAHRHGLKFDHRIGSHEWEDRFLAFESFQGGDESFNIMEGFFGGRQICAFDCRYLGGIEGPRHYSSFVIVQAGLLLEPLSSQPMRFARKAPASGEGQHPQNETVEYCRYFAAQCPGGPRLRCEFQGSQVLATTQAGGSGLDGRFTSKEFAGALQVLTDILDDSLGPAAREQNGVESGV